MSASRGGHARSGLRLLAAGPGLGPPAPGARGCWRCGGDACTWSPAAGEVGSEVAAGGAPGRLLLLLLLLLLLRRRRRRRQGRAAGGAANRQGAL
jgi:hypothetical protein